MGSGTSSLAASRLDDAVPSTIAPSSSRTVELPGSRTASRLHVSRVLSMARLRTLEARDEAARPWGIQDNIIQKSSRMILKERIQCMCEGGKACSREDPASQNGRNPIPNLHSNWVTDDLLAMARPWQSYLVDPSRGLMLEFRRSKIELVLNLQELGEHANCGPGILPNTGFSYDPESFMAAGIHVFNGAWRDMGCPTMKHLISIVQIMSHFLQRGKKVAVHCHAGLGRTGLAIAASLVYERRFNAAEAIALVRRQRPGALQTRAQEQMVYAFERRLAYLRHQFIVEERKRHRVRMAAAAAALISQGQGVTAHNESRQHRGSRSSSNASGSPELSRCSSGNNSQSSAAQQSGPVFLTPVVEDDARSAESESGSWTLQRLAANRPGIHKGRRNKGRSNSKPLVDLQDVLVRQRELIGGEERRILFHLPKFIYCFLQELETRSIRWKRSTEHSQAEHLPLASMNMQLQRYLEVRQNGSFQELESQHSGYVSLEQAKLKINEGSWSILQVIGTPVLLAMLELWVIQLAKPSPEEHAMFVNAVGVIRTRSINAPCDEVVRRAANHLSLTMRHYVHGLVQICQVLSDSDESHMICESAVTWLVTAICSDGADSAEPVSTTSSQKKEYDDACNILSEFFLFAGASLNSTDAILPGRKMDGKADLGTDTDDMNAEASMTMSSWLNAPAHRRGSNGSKSNMLPNTSTNDLESGELTQADAVPSRPQLIIPEIDKNSEYYTCQPCQVTSQDTEQQPAKSDSSIGLKTGNSLTTPSAVIPAVSSVEVTAPQFMCSDKRLFKTTLSDEERNKAEWMNLPPLQTEVHTSNNSSCDGAQAGLSICAGSGSGSNQDAFEDGHNEPDSGSRKSEFSVKSETITDADTRNDQQEPAILAHDVDPPVSGILPDLLAEVATT